MLKNCQTYFFCIFFVVASHLIIAADKVTPISISEMGTDKMIQFEIKSTDGKSIFIRWLSTSNEKPSILRTNKKLESLSLDSLKIKNESLFDKILEIKNTIEHGGRNIIKQKNSDRYSKYQVLFDELIKQSFDYHWSIQPTVSSVLDVPNQLKLVYPENTSVLDIKKLIYQQLAQNSNDSTLKDKMYNILVNQDTRALNDNEMMQDIDSLDQGAKDSFSLRLNKSNLTLHLDRVHPIAFTFSNPPSISINDVPTIHYLTMAITKAYEGLKETPDIEILLDQDGNYQKSVQIKDTNFTKIFTEAPLLDDDSKKIAFFKKVLSYWADALDAKVSFQAEHLTLKKQTNATNIRSFFNWIPNFQKIKTWFQQKAASIFIGGATLAAIVGTVYKSNPALFNTPTWFDVWWWHKGSSSVPAQPSARVSLTK